MSGPTLTLLGWPALACVACVVLAASLTSLRNGFAFDDQEIIVRNPNVQSLLAPWRYFLQTYWPNPADGGLYRPISVLGFALERALGGGAPVAFHVASVLLKILVSVALLQLARRLVPPPAALVGALVFAANPLHNEAVGNIVGQAELHMTLGALLALIVYVDARRNGTPGPRAIALLVAASAYGLLGKEQGLVLPATLLVFELLFVEDARPARARMRALIPTYAALVTVMTLLWLARTVIIHGSLAGAVAWPWRGLSLWERVVATLGLVPQWTRLLLVPWHLRVEYNPPSIAVAPVWGLPQLLGGLVLAAGTAAVALTWRRAPAIAAGLLWSVVALLPVANLLVPTGVVIAERTLLQPSAGVALALAGVAALALASLQSNRLAWRGAQAAAAALVALLAWRSAVRMPVWKDDETVIRQMLVDDPRSYYAHFNRGLVFESVGAVDSADAAFRTAIGQWDGDGRVLEHYAERLWLRGEYAEVVPLLARTLAIEENRPPARKLLYESLTKIGQADSARQVALRGIELGDPGFMPRVATPRRSR